MRRNNYIEENNTQSEGSPYLNMKEKLQNSYIDGEYEASICTNDTFMQTITELSDKIDSISKCYEEKIKYDEGKQTTINRQYSELQSIREGIPYSYLKSIIKDIRGVSLLQYISCRYER